MRCCCFALFYIIVGCLCFVMFALLLCACVFLKYVIVLFVCFCVVSVVLLLLFFGGGLFHVTETQLSVKYNAEDEGEQQHT